MEEEFEDVDQSHNSVPILLDLAFASNVCCLSKYQYYSIHKKKLFDSDNFPVEGSLPGRPRDVHEQQHRALQDSSLRQRGWIHFHLDESLTKIWKQFDQNWETFLLKPGENLIKIRRKLDQNQVIIQPGDNGSGDLGLLDVCHLLQCLCSSPSSSTGEIDHHD